MEEIAALVQERATFLKGRLAMEVPGWTIRWRHACVRGTRSIDGLLLRFRSDRGRRDDDPDLGWVWRWQVVEGASRVVLASGDHHSEAQLDLVGVASFVSDRAAGVVFRQGFYR